MKTIVFAAFAIIAPLNAFAASVEEPVKAIMDVAVARWEDNSTAGDYFDDPHLTVDYSKAFVAVYREAGKYPAYDGSNDPFDYDVITSSQDGCPLKHVKIEKGDERDGLTTIDVSFRLWDCDKMVEAAEKAKVSQLRFDVIVENGKPVINDIHRRGDDGQWDSLVAEMKEDIKTGEAQK